jgi:peptide/nickel transport system ATP-binding protein
MSTLLDVDDLRVTFPTRTGLIEAVRGVSFSLGRERLGIVGESGSGKSVSFLATLGLLAHNARITGSAKVAGIELVGANRQTLDNVRGKKAAMIFQDPLSALNPVHRIGDQIVEMIQSHQDVTEGVAAKRAVELLDVVGIPQPDQRARQYPHEFSGGMRQRVMIAMAIANDPDVLIADEPTTALDVTVQAQILDLLEDLQREFNSAIIMITHDLGVIAQIADDVLVMYGGRAVETGSVEQVMRSPQHPYTWGLLASVPSLHGDAETDLVPVKGNPPSLINLPSGCAFHPRCRYAGRNGNLSFSEVPKLRPTGQEGHQVACHLSPADRLKLYQEDIAHAGVAQ